MSHRLLPYWIVPVVVATVFVKIFYSLAQQPTVNIFVCYLFWVHQYCQFYLVCANLKSHDIDYRSFRAGLCLYASQLYLSKATTMLLFIPQLTHLYVISL